MSVVGGDELYVFHRSAFNSLIFGIAGMFYIFLYISYILYISKINYLFSWSFHYSTLGLIDCLLKNEISKAQHPPKLKNKLFSSKIVVVVINFGSRTDFIFQNEDEQF